MLGANPSSRLAVEVFGSDFPPTYAASFSHGLLGRRLGALVVVLSPWNTGVPELGSEQTFVESLPSGDRLSHK